MRNHGFVRSNQSRLIGYKLKANSFKYFKQSIYLVYFSTNF